MSDANVAKALRALAAKNKGRLTPEAVIDAARDPKSPLHDRFTWDNDKAASEHRLNEARALIRSVRIEVVTNNYRLSAPEFVRDPAAGERQGYATHARLRSDEDVARAAVVAEFERAAAALYRARAVAVALGMSEEIEEIRGRVIALADRLQEQEAAAAA